MGTLHTSSSTRLKSKVNELPRSDQFCGDQRLIQIRFL